MVLILRDSLHAAGTEHVLEASGPIALELCGPRLEDRIMGAEQLLHAKREG